MKVDKAVCTKATQKDQILTKTIQYDTVFTTLIENKISAIKRECESKNKKSKRQKQSNKPFGKIFFGRRIFGGDRRSNDDDGGSDYDNNDDGKLNLKSSNTCAEVVIDIEKDEQKNAIKIVDNQRQTIDVKGHDEISRITTIPNTVTVVASATSGSNSRAATAIGIESILHQERKIKSEIESDDETSVSVQKFSKINNGNGSLDGKGIRNLVVEVITHREGQGYDDSSGGGCDGTLIHKNDNKSVIRVDETTNERNIESSSLGSIRIDESTNADDSLTSIKDSVESLSFPSSYCTISGAAATVSNEREFSRLRVLEAKSISAQCSPILPRQLKAPHLCSTQTQTYHYPKLSKSQVSYSDNHHDISDYHNHDALRFFSRQNTSEDSVNLTVSTLLHEADSINAFGERKSKSTSILIIADKDNKKAINRLDSNSNISNPLVRGFISSLNQLTTTSNYFPVITTTITALRSKTSVTKATNNSDQLYSKSATSSSSANPTAATIVKTTTTPAVNTNSTNSTALITATTSAAPITTTISSYDNAKLQRMTSTSTGSSAAPIGCCNTKAFSKDKDKRQKPLWQTGQSGSDDEYRKRKRKYKRYHRCSDPVLVYPSSRELQHCILSMPPNQPIQFYYNDDFLYDLPLQMEADQNGDLQAIVPSHRSKRHTHHRHKKRTRHQKPKILVHDLDTRVKVIDPDDLPQRARWTIIATACLLLLMCLMLVGITLRMAPIIDDMVLLLLELMKRMTW